MLSESTEQTTSVQSPPMLANSCWRYQVRFSKSESLVWIGHQDLMKVFERLFRRVNLPVAQSQGFNPRPRMNLVQALGLGIEAHREVLEVELTQPIVPESLIDQLNQSAPAGLRFYDARWMTSRKSGQAEQIRYTFEKEIPAERMDSASSRMEDFLSAPTFQISRVREKETVQLDLRPLVEDISWTQSGRLSMTLRVTPQATARPEEVLSAIGLGDLFTLGSLIRHDVILREFEE
jgi:radical SAM-linked protein